MTGKTTTKKSTGKRGPKSRINPQLIARLVDIIEQGNFREAAARVCGVSPALLSRWMAKKGEPYRSLRRAIEQAEERAHCEAVNQIYRAGRDDPKMLQWWLERKFSAQWGRRVAVGGDAGAPPIAVQVTDDAKQKLAGKLSSILASLEAEEGDREDSGEPD